MTYQCKTRLEAVQYDGTNIDEVLAFCGPALYCKRTEQRVELDNFGLTEVKYVDEYFVKWTKLNPTDYAVRDCFGDFYHCKAPIFEATYEAVKE
jgi:hypothetical protein